jgi:uncharacterized membrane protein
MSPFLNLNWKDLGKAVLMAFLTTFITSVAAAFQAGAFPTLAQLGSYALLGLSAAGAYLVKNLFTNSKNQLATPESK